MCCSRLGESPPQPSQPNSADATRCLLVQYSAGGAAAASAKQAASKVRVAAVRLACSACLRSLVWLVVALDVGCGVGLIFAFALSGGCVGAAAQEDGPPRARRQQPLTVRGSRAERNVKGGGPCAAAGVFCDVQMNIADTEYRGWRTRACDFAAYNIWAWTFPRRPSRGHTCLLRQTLP